MKFRTYNTQNDTQYYVSFDKTVSEPVTKSENRFIFTGFRNGIHPYHRNRINWFTKILASNGIILNVKEVPTVDDMSTDPDLGWLSYDVLKIPSDFGKKSADGNVYILFQDTELGRGWACLIRNNEILMQEHRDTILDILEQGEFIRSFGIDYQVEYINDKAEIEKQS